MGKPHKILLLFLLLLLPGFMLLGQQPAPQNQSSRESARRQAADERAKQEREALLKQELLKYPEFEKLSSEQKKHLQVYWQAKKLRLANKYDHKKDFEPQFGPIAASVEAAYPVLLEVAKKAEAMRDENFQAGKQRLAERADICAGYYRELAKICQDIVAAYKEQNGGKIYPLMIAYRRGEANLLLEGVSVPKREWLTTHEAEMLSRAIARRNKNRTR